MKENNNINLQEKELYTNDTNNDINIKSRMDNNRLASKYKSKNLNINNNRKNKSTQLFETLLGSKLILTENSNMLIEKPFTIFEILEIIHSNIELDAKMEIIEKLKMIILKHHINSAIIMEKSSLKDSKSEINISFLNELIKIMIDNSREPKLIEELLNLLEILIKNSETRIEYFWNIFQRISQLCEKNKTNYDGTKFLLYLKIINKLFTKSNHDDIINPSKFFFFNNDKSELLLDNDSLQSKNINLLNGFTFGIWVYLEKVNHDSTNKNISPNSKLFYIKTKKNLLIEATLEDNKLYYYCGNSEIKKESNDEEEDNDQNQKDNKSKKKKKNKLNLERKKSESIEDIINKDKKFLGNIEYNQWTLLVFTHKPVGFLQKPQFILYTNNLDNEKIIDYEYPNFGNQKISKIGICKGFTGLVSNVFMFNQALVQKKVLEEIMNYKYGLYNEENINVFKSYIEQEELHDKSNNEKNKIFLLFKEFFKSIMFIYSPCRIKDNNICLDLVNNINAELNIQKELNLIGGIYSRNKFGNNIYQIGGASIFLPIYEYIFSSIYKSSIILEEGIQIIINIFNNETYYMGEKVKEDKHFFRNLYYIINKNLKNSDNNNTNLFTKEIMLKLYDLGTILINNDKQKIYSKSFFDYIFLNTNIIKLYPLQVQKELYQKLKELYYNNCEYLFSIFDIKDILKNIIELYDNNANNYCCKKHYQMLNEDQRYDIKSKKNKDNKIYSQSLLNKVFDLLEIMKYILTNDKIVAISQIKNINLALIMEISPCLQISLIRILQIIFGINEKIKPSKTEENNSTNIISMEKEYIKIFCDNNGIEHLLYVLATSTLDVRYECLRLFYLICSSDYWNKKNKLDITNQIIPFITINLFIMRNHRENKMVINEFNVNDILFTGKDEIYTNNENLDKMKNELDDEINQYNNNENDIIKSNNDNETISINDEDDNNKENIIKEESQIDIKIVIKNLSLPINYIKNFSNKINDIFVEKIYTFLIQWLINRFENSISLDDSDEIYNPYILTILMNFVMNNGIIIKSKFLRDLYTLSYYNLKNCKIILENNYFHQWLMDILLIYQILYDNGYKDKTLSQKGICESLLSLGIKLHNIIIVNATLYEHKTEQENNSNSINNHIYIFQFLITWLYKIKKIGNIHFSSAYNLINNIISDLITRLKPMLTKENILQYNLIWTCFLNLTLIAYEFYFIYNYCVNKNFKHNSSIINYLSSKSNNVDKMFELSFAIDEEVLYNIENITSPQIENSKKILLFFYQGLKTIWDLETKDIIIEDDINGIENFLDTIIFGQNENEFSLEMNLLLYSTEDLPLQDIKINSIMESILNIIIMFIKTRKSKEDIIYWIIELKKFLIYLLIISHNIHPQNTSILTKDFVEKIKDKISSVFIISLNFIRNEIKNLEESNNGENKPILEEYNKLFKLLIISYILIIERILIEKEKNKNKSSGIFSSIISAIDTLKNFVKKSFGYSYEYSPFKTIYKEIFLNSENQPLFNLTDIENYRKDNFEEVLNKINNNQEWKDAIFEGPKALSIINNQFALSYYEKNTKIRISNGDNIHINKNIYINEKKFIRNKTTDISDSINKSLKIIINDINQIIFNNIITLQKSKTELKSLHKKYFTWKGKWIYIKDYIDKVSKGEIKFKLGNHYSWDFLCPCLYSVDDFEQYIPKFMKYDAKKYLFIENNNINNSIILIEEDKEKNRKIINNDIWTSFKMSRTTNKSNMYIIYDKNENIIHNDEDSGSDSEQNNNIRELSNLLYKKENFENYNEIQKLLCYNSNTLNYDKCILDITNLYIDKLKNSENKNKKPNKIYYNCCLIKLKGHIPIVLLCSNNYIYFIMNYNYGKIQKENEKCIGSLFCFDPNKHKLIKKIEKKNIRQIFKRRYYYIENSLELFTHTNKSYYIKFNTKKERDEFYLYIMNSYNDISLFKDDALSIMKKWEHWDISTMSFLSIINNFAGRSFKDLTQYPVFPWVIKDYESNKLNSFNETNIRELNKPIGALGNENRLECFLQTYKESKELEIEAQNKKEKKKNKKKKEEKNTDKEGNNRKDSDNDSINFGLEEKRYFYSSHYSNPFYVVHYMSKIFPYSFCAIELQGNGFDKRERQFLSIINSWNNCMNEATDVRELIPEFFFLPEMFINFNKINFLNEKINEENMNDIDNFEYSKWSKNNPNLFIIKNRLALESDYVSDNLNEWIDLIFGFKQKGEEAEKAKNLFFDFTYENSIDIEKIQKNNLDEYNSLISKVDIGQTPSQIYTRAVDKRMKRKDINLKKIINFEKISKWKSHCSQSEKINSISYNSNIKELAKKMVIYIKALNNRKIICVFNNGFVIFLKEEYTLFSESGLVFINEKTIKIPTDLVNNRIVTNNNYPNIIEEDFDLLTEIDKEQPITSILNGKYLIKGGYHDSKFMIHETFHVYKNKFIYIYLEDETKINVIKSDGEEEKFLYIGTTNGKLFVYKINKNTDNINDILKYHTLLIDHNKSLNDIYIDTKLNILATVSSDKTCNIYTYPDLKLFRVISLHELNSLDNVFISNMPLPSIIIYSKTDTLFYSFTINGSFILKKKNMFKEIYSPKISKDVYGRDYLIYGTKYRAIVITRLPLFTKEEYIEIKNDNYNFPIKSLELREESEIIYFWRLHNYNLSYLKNKIVNSNATTDNINLYI